MSDTTEAASQTLAEQLLEAIEQNDGEAMAILVNDMPAPDFAEFVREQALDLSHKLLSFLAIEQRARVFGYFQPEDQKALAEQMPQATLAELLTHMNSDERADLFNQLADNLKAQVMRLLAHNEREDLRLLASYAEGTAGALMSSDYVAVPARSTVAQAFEIIRATAPSAETVYDIYCIDHMGRLVGTVSLRQLILARKEARLEKVMATEVVTATVDEAQETVANLIAHYDLLALPIIDLGGRLVGIVTYDDAMDVAEQEATEDIHRGASVQPLDRGLSTSSLFAVYKSRVVWLVLLVFGNIFSGAGIAHFEDTIAAQVALVFFLPLLIGSGGNAGSQAATLIVRGLATGEVRMRDWFRLFGREVLIAAALGLTMALAIAPIGAIRGGEIIAMTVGLTMVTVVIFGSLAGLSLPFLLRRIGWDPATASAPLVTTLIDACGVLIYFGIATALLNLPAAT
ncbi:magnesium transporter [Natronospirillum operosum]|uniref:Magnesium transporter MgtE n=1 Tax=Natronospirillum operosum TaxID=2759953 RepID=A0A4Z0WIF5_9GAMM|nr:magnesium transporter [Natronospirillum operosum]TGG95213.1 magnesium transporter [Natronospirillum operosum]